MLAIPAISVAIGFGSLNQGPAAAAAVPNQRPAGVRAEPPGTESVVRPTLWVGDAAPALVVERWVRGGEGPVRTPLPLAPGKVTVVEFWATWCAPCAQSIPSLTELQTRYRDQGFKVIGVASQEMVAADLERFVAKQGDRIAYPVALDDNGASNQAWMLAAGQKSIPMAFVVNQQGKIAWIGHPLEGLDEVVRQVLGGKYDLEAAAAAHRKRVELDMKAEPIRDRFLEASEEGRHADAVIAAGELVALDPMVFGRYAVLRFQIQAVSMKEPETALRDGQKAVDGLLRENAEALVSLATAACDEAKGQPGPMLTLAGNAADRAEELTAGKRGDVLALRARIAHASGRGADALDLLTRAIELTPDGAEREAMRKKLEEYRKGAGK